MAEYTSTEESEKDSFTHKNSELLESSKSNSSDARVDLNAIKTQPPRLEGRSYLYIV